MNVNEAYRREIISILMRACFLEVLDLYARDDVRQMVWYVDVR
ncbi:MAG: hypothetical protein BWY45_02525 [Euryarchaeota archaeon ADurb.Bin294]|jgi:hypothetical protein|nr:MAG: hypothetical protein BWY45_02525 [Euryarchaeota archaeon ADurb.Bin294]